MTSYTYFDTLNMMLCLKFVIEFKKIEKIAIFLKNQQNTITHIWEMSTFYAPTVYFSEIVAKLDPSMGRIARLAIGGCFDINAVVDILHRFDRQTPGTVPDVWVVVLLLIEAIVIIVLIGIYIAIPAWRNRKETKKNFDQFL